MLLAKLWYGDHGLGRLEALALKQAVPRQAAEMVQQLMVPLEEGVNEHKRLQLRELAELNGMQLS